MADKMDNLLIKVLYIVNFVICVQCYSHADINQLLSTRGYDFKDIMRRQMGGPFTIGINDPKSRTGEYPVRPTEVKPFYMDVFPVTVAQFWRYKMKKPRYRTTAEREGFSWVLDSFVSNHVRRLWSAPSDNKTSWWLSVTGAQWDRPEGPGSHARDRLDYPVVHLSYSDAKAYCQFIGKRLPNEEEWEFAARAELQGQQYPWGDKYENKRMNIWQGTFPEEDKGADGWRGLSPVNAFPAQNNATMYDMLGNVWEWTTTKYYTRGVDRRTQPLRYVLKGGSYLDTRDGSSNYIVRTANRIGKEPSYTAHNVGFRCAASAPQLAKKMKEKDQRLKKPVGKRVPRLHKFEEMALQPPKRNKKVKGKRAQMREFIKRSDKKIKKTIKHKRPMRREEL